ncbi:hypothetical protein ACHAWF_002044 [Thalassiosira exigua]
MDPQIKKLVFNHIQDFWYGIKDHENWHRSQCVPVPKQGDLSNPNKWRGVMLMDVCSKIFSVVMNDRAFTLLQKHGTKFQFGGTPHVGCRDGLFTLKTLLNMRKNHNLEPYVTFMDLVKAYDTANHDLLIKILAKYGAPQIMRGNREDLPGLDSSTENWQEIRGNTPRSWSKTRRQHGTSPLHIPHGSIC